jgi:CheY-like chemotaxis protein
MPRGGRVTISTRNVMFGPENAPHFEIKPGAHVMLAVSDQGEGMDQATIARIFEPFFTTKEQGKGTGLGLATVYGIVKQSGGGVFVYSEPGQGTTFKVYLPIVGGAPEPVAAAAPGQPRTGTETVLLVDDDEMVRNFVERVLRQHGYTVHAAADAEAALAVCAREAASIRLLLTDVVMPGMNGAELAVRVRSLLPGVRVVFMSGYTDEAIVDRALASATASYMQKPLTVDGVTRKVREALDAPAPQA